MTTLAEVKAWAIKELNEWFADNLDDPDPYDMVWQIADDSVVKCRAELVEVALSDKEVLTHKNELGPSFDGGSTMLNWIATAVFEIVHQVLSDRLDELQAEQEQA